MDLFWCISMTNNVESCKKIDGRVQTFRFSVFTMGRQELHAENAKKTPKLEKLKRKLLNFLKMYDLYRVVPWESQRPDSWQFRKCCSFWVLEVLNQSYWPSKLGENWRKNSKERNRNKKKTRPQFWVLCSEIESAGDQHGCFNADSISSRNFQNCGRVFFLLRLIIFGTLSLFQPCVDFERW